MWINIWPIYFTGGKEVTNNSRNDSRLMLYFAPNVLRSEEHYMYDMGSLIADFGGYVGLLIGYSFSHLAMLLNDIIDVYIESIKKDQLSSEGSGQIRVSNFAGAKYRVYTVNN